MLLMGNNISQVRGYRSSWLICWARFSWCSWDNTYSNDSKHFPNENRSKRSFVTASGGLGIFIFPILSNLFENISTWQSSFIIFL